MTHREDSDFLFNIGDKVAYVLNGVLVFVGEIAKRETDTNLKPYVIITEGGLKKYAHEKQLRKIP